MDQGGTSSSTGTEGRGLSRGGEMYGDQQETRKQVERIQMQPFTVLRLPEQSLIQQWNIIIIKTLYCILTLNNKIAIVKLFGK